MARYLGPTPRRHLGDTSQERPAAESLGVKFAEVNTEAGFSLGKGESEWFAVQGFLSVCVRGEVRPRPDPF